MTDQTSGENSLDEAERQILELLAYHRQAYERSVQPLYERLGQIRDCRPRRYVVTMDDAMAAGLIMEELPRG